MISPGFTHPGNNDPAAASSLPAGFACRLPPPLLARTWLFSRAASIQPEKALSQPRRRFRARFGAEWQQCALTWPVFLPSTVATNAPVTAGIGRAVILQMLPSKGIPTSPARRTLIGEKVNREMWSEGKAGERYAPCVEVLSLMRDINK